MSNQTVDAQTRMYLYDLMNTASEHGFKADDIWELSMVTDSGRAKLQKAYYPAVSMKVGPEILLQVFHATQKGLKQSTYNNENQLPTAKAIIAEDINYLVAFNLKRPRG